MRLRTRSNRVQLESSMAYRSERGETGTHCTGQVLSKVNNCPDVSLPTELSSTAALTAGLRMAGPAKEVPVQHRQSVNWPVNNCWVYDLSLWRSPRIDVALSGSKLSKAKRRMEGIQPWVTGTESGLGYWCKNMPESFRAGLTERKSFRGSKMRVC